MDLVLVGGSIFSPTFDFIISDCCFEIYYSYAIALPLLQLD